MIYLYYIVFLGLFLLTLFSLTHYSKKVDHTLAFVVSIFFVIIGTIKWKMGPDWGHYYYFFLYVSNQDNPVWLHEPLYSFINVVAKHTLNSFIVVQFIQVFVSVYCKYFAFKRYSKYLMFAMLLNYGFYLADMFTVRNFMAGAIAFWSIKYIEERKPLRFIITILIATNIHISSFLFLIAYPIFHFRTSILTKTFALLVAVFLGIFNVIELLIGQSAALAVIFSDRLGDKLGDYEDIGNSGVQNDANAGLIMVLGIVKRLVIFPIIFYFEQHFYKEDKQFRGLVNLFTFGNIIYFVALHFKIFQRISIPFYAVEIPILLMIYLKAKNKPLFFIIFTVYAITKMAVLVDARYMGEFISIFTRDIPGFWDRFDKGVWQ